MKRAELAVFAVVVVVKATDLGVVVNPETVLAAKRRAIAD